MFKERQEWKEKENMHIFWGLSGDLERFTGHVTNETAFSDTTFSS